MVGSEKAQTHKVRIVFSEGLKGKGLGEIISFILSWTDGTKNGNSFVD